MKNSGEHHRISAYFERTFRWAKQERLHFAGLLFSKVFCVHLDPRGFRFPHVILPTFITYFQICRVTAVMVSPPQALHLFHCSPKQEPLQHAFPAGRQKISNEAFPERRLNIRYGGEKLKRLGEPDTENVASTPEKGQNRNNAITLSTYSTHSARQHKF